MRTIHVPSLGFLLSTSVLEGAIWIDIAAHHVSRGLAALLEGPNPYVAIDT